MLYSVGPEHPCWLYSCTVGTSPPVVQNRLGETPPCLQVCAEGTFFMVHRHSLRLCCVPYVVSHSANDAGPVVDCDVATLT